MKKQEILKIVSALNAKRNDENVDLANDFLLGFEQNLASCISSPSSPADFQETKKILEAVSCARKVLADFRVESMAAASVRQARN